MQCNQGFVHLGGMVGRVSLQLFSNVSGEHIGPFFKVQAAHEQYTLKMAPIRLPEALVTTYQPTRRNIPEELRPLHRGASLKSRCTVLQVPLQALLLLERDTNPGLHNRVQTNHNDQVRCVVPFTERRRSAARADGTAALLQGARSNGNTKHDCGNETFLS